MNDISRENALAHFGVKGMRWGVRKQPTTSPSTTTKPRMSKKTKTAIAVAVLTAGIAVTAVFLNQRGQLPIKDISRNKDGKLWDDVVKDFAKKNSPTPQTSAHSTARKGAEFIQKTAADLDYEKAKRLVAEFDKSIKEAHKNLTEQAKKDNPNYVPRLDPYIPSYELERLYG